MIIRMSRSMKTFAVKMTDIFYLYIFIFTFDFIIASIKTGMTSFYSSHKSRVKSRKAYSFVIIYDAVDTCQKFSKRSGLLVGVQNLRIN